MVYQGLETEVGNEDVITIMPISHGGSQKTYIAEEVNLYRKNIEDLERRCKIEYYRGYGGAELAAFIDRILNDRCNGQAYFLILGKDLLVTPRVIMATLGRLERIRRRSGFIARKPSIELLLRILGTRNISKAVESIRSVESGEKNVIIITCAERCIDRLDGLEKIDPGEEEMRKGLESIARICLKNRSQEKPSGKALEELERIVISCGVLLELEE